MPPPSRLGGVGSASPSLTPSGALGGSEDILSAGSERIPSNEIPTEPAGEMNLPIRNRGSARSGSPAESSIPTTSNRNTPFNEHHTGEAGSNPDPYEAPNEVASHAVAPLSPATSATDLSPRILTPLSSTTNGFSNTSNDQPTNPTSPAWGFHRLFNSTPLPTPRASPRLTPSLTSRDEDDNERESLSENDTQNSQAESSNPRDNRERTTYDANSEGTPNKPYFAPEFQAALRGSARILDQMVSLLSSYAPITPEAETRKSELLSQAERLRSFSNSTSKTIAVVGDSGEGKSSLINSLLHIPDLAIVGDSGSACTSVVTEYRQRDRRHTAPITIEVDRLTTQEIEELLEELVHNYRQLYAPGIEEDASGEDYCRYETESSHAWSVLQTAFHHKAEFSERFLQDQSPGAARRIVEKLVRWSDDLPWPGSGHLDTWTADSVDECNETTSTFMSDRLWPFTRLIRIYLSAQVLKTGVVLVDLPGLHDTNLARVRASQNYLMRCDHIFVVTKIQRAITDQSVNSSLYSILRNHVSSDWSESSFRRIKIAIVCSKTEDINANALRREFVGPRKRISNTVMSGLDRNLEQAKRDNDRILKKQIKRRRDYLLIQARNDHVSEGLKRAYESRVAGGNLDVFCISNTHYGKFCRKNDTEYVQKTGIPGLRRFCHSITADSQYNEARHYLEVGLPGFLRSMNIFFGAAATEVVEPSSANRIMDAYEELQTKLKSHIRQAKRGFDSTFVEQILSLNRRLPQWKADAIQRSDQWNSWHYSTKIPIFPTSPICILIIDIAQYNAWCGNNGCHHTDRRGYVNWNAELIWKMKSELSFSWDIFEENAAEIFDPLISRVEESMEEFRDLVEEHTQGANAASVIDGHTEDIRHCLKLKQMELEQEVRYIRDDASSDRHTSYIMTQMIPTYRSAFSIRGSGMKARQQNTVQGKVKDELFENIALSLQSDIELLSNHAFATSVSQESSSVAPALPPSRMTRPNGSQSLGDVCIFTPIQRVLSNLRVDMENVTATGRHRTVPANGARMAILMRAQRDLGVLEAELNQLRSVAGGDTP